MHCKFNIKLKIFDEEFRKHEVDWFQVMGSIDAIAELSS